MTNAEWSSDRIRRVLEENEFTYQRVPLPHGLVAGGKDRSSTAERIFPADLGGKSVFDLGCMYGYFCFAAEERGAVRCLGVDIDPDNVRKASLLADVRGSRAQFRLFDIETDDIPDRFDYVLCLNVLHHLRNPLAALDELIRATKDSLVLEVAAFGPRDRKKNHASWLAGHLLARYPILFVARQSSQTFFVTRDALQRLFLDHRADFARVDFIDHGHKGRLIAIARRRRIKRLFVVAGMSAGGKSSFISSITSPDGADLARQIGFDRTQPWTPHLFGKLLRNREQAFDGVILHYNITKHLNDGDLYHHSRALADLMSVSDDVKVVTIARPRELLLKDFQESRTGKIRKRLLSRRHRKKLRRIVDLIGRPESLNGLYDDWLRFLDRKGLPRTIIAADEGRFTLGSTDSLRL